MIDLRLGDCLEGMQQLYLDSIDATITSPPYDKLRDYKGYVFDFKGIARELYRITKPGGVVVWIVGDAVVKGGETGTSFRQALFFQEIGFSLHDTMIYEKLNFSHPDKTRYHNVFEYMFILSKGSPKTFNPIKDKPNKTVGKTCFGVNQFTNRDGTKGVRSRKFSSEFGMRHNVWLGKTRAQEEICVNLKHPAMMPKWLARDHVISWTNEGDVVLDPFMGSGTVGVACAQFKRDFIGYEISEEYFNLASTEIGKAHHVINEPSKVNHTSVNQRMF